jgi:DNA-binding XRE family transcriptional regulator
MDLSDLDKYGEFGFRSDYVHDPNDIMSIYDARREVVMNMDLLPLHHQLKTKRCHDNLSQAALGKIVRLPASTISLIERGERLIPKNRYKEFEAYLYEMWFQDGVLIDRFSDDYNEVPIEMDVEAQRSFWKVITDNDPDLRGTIL